MTGDSHNLKSLGVVETRVSLSVHCRILSLPKHYPALTLRPSLVHPRTLILFSIDTARARLPRASASSARRAIRLICHFLSIPCPLVFIGAFLMLIPFV
jgi:hypothetical protein